MHVKIHLSSLLIISLTFILFCTPPAAINVQVMKPAAIHLPGIRTLAVADFQGQGRSGSQIATRLQAYLLETDYYDILERDKLKQILDEQNLGMTGVVDEATAVEIGKLLGVDAMIFGEVTEYQVEQDERGKEKVHRKVGTGKYEWVEQKNIFTGKKSKVKKEIMKTVLVDQHYRIRRGTAAINFRAVKVETGELLAVHSDSKSYNSGKVIEGSNKTLKPIGEILSNLSGGICRKFVGMIAPHYVDETRYVESGKGLIKTGKKYAENGLWPEAVDAWEQATVIHPKEPSVWYNLGAAAEMDGDLDLAEEYYKKAVALKQKDLYMESIQRIRKKREDQAKLEEQFRERDEVEEEDEEEVEIDPFDGSF
ncbi:tetratricopeptide repeat protein [candidate division KSB1 bacterium]|nr:tetratricopeptide repeat protein [candidate division KSB1 bacterium]